MSTSHYQKHGFTLGPVVLDPETIQSTNQAMDQIISETPEKSNMGKAYDPERDLGKFNEAHIYSPEIFDAITSPSLGKAIAEITGYERVQVWATQMLNKPGGATSTASVGWHQDYQYWQAYWTPDSELFTVWLALSDVMEESGPVNFVSGSHHWGFLNKGNFFQDIKEQNTESSLVPNGESWNEIPATMSAGAFSVHHKHTFHGSYANTSSRVRRSIAIHLCSEKSTPTPGKSHDYDYAAYVDDPLKCPVIFDSNSQA